MAEGKKKFSDITTQMNKSDVIMTKSTTQGDDWKKVGDVISTVDNNLIRDTVVQTTREYLVRYCFSIQHDSDVIDNNNNTINVWYIENEGVNGERDSYFYVDDTRKDEFKITKNGALYNSNV